IISLFVNLLGIDPMCISNSSTSRMLIDREHDLMMN
ncbi:unnamed protein product, partial [Rotaria sp. Silwood2]